MKTFGPIVALLIIIGAAVYLFSFYRSQPKPGQAVLHKAPVACEACDKAYITMLGDQPAKCYYCDAEAIWHATQCANPKCSEIIPIVGGPSHGTASSITCPKCGGTVFREVSPDGLEEH